MAQQHYIIARQASALAGAGGQRGNPARMPGQPTRSQVGEVTKRLEYSLHGCPVQPTPGGRLEADYLIPQRRLLELVEQPLCQLGEKACGIRREHRAGAIAQRSNRHLGASHPLERLRRLGHLHDLHRNR